MSRNVSTIFTYMKQDTMHGLASMLLASCLQRAVGTLRLYSMVSCMFSVVRTRTVAYLVICRPSILSLVLGTSSRILYLARDRAMGYQWLRIRTRLYYLVVGLLWMIRLLINRYGHLTQEKCNSKLLDLVLEFEQDDHESQARATLRETSILTMDTEATIVTQVTNRARID